MGNFVVDLFATQIGFVDKNRYPLEQRQKKTNKNKFSRRMVN